MTMDKIAVITSVERRRRWSAAEKARLVAAMDEPGAVVTEIARKAEVNASILYRWRRELRGACRAGRRVGGRAAIHSAASETGFINRLSSKPERFIVHV